MVRIAHSFKPLSEEEINRLLDVFRQPARDGHIDDYKNRQGG
jgi:hypothetical protein